MTTISRCATLSLALALTAPLGCAGSAGGAEDDAVSSEQDLIAGRAGAVYALSNAAASNEVIDFRRAANGSLQRAASHATGGKGSGDGLGSQGRSFSARTGTGCTPSMRARTSCPSSS